MESGSQLRSSLPHVVLIREFEHELDGIGKVFGRVKHELAQLDDS
jgi:hypothetical protein